METAVTILSAAGFLAVAWRMLRSLLRALTRTADVLAEHDRATTRAHRGDLTGLEEAKLARVDASRRRYLALGSFAAWTVLLIIPPLSPFQRELYAAYSLLWLVPRRTRGSHL